jgi:MurNAc alpha-1-phosphate uridylyltransferase
MTEPTLSFSPDVMLLAAGLGTRMLPLTARRPKPLIEVAGKALLDHAVEAALAEGLDRFVINAHYLADLVAAHVAGLEDRYPEARFRISLERARPLGTGGGVKNALSQLETDPILVMNTDAFWPRGADRPIGRMLDSFTANEAEIVLLCAHKSRATGFRRSHDFCLDPRGRITLDTGAPVIYAGVALISRDLFVDTPDTPFSLTTLFDRALESGTLFGVALNAPWLHVGDPKALEEAELLLSTLTP